MFDIVIGSTSCIGDSMECVSNCARALSNELKSRGFSVWFGTDDITIGNLILSANGEAIDNGKVCMLFLSEDSKYVLGMSSKLTKYIRKRRENDGISLRLIYVTIGVQGVYESSKYAKYDLDLDNNPWVYMGKPDDSSMVADKIIEYIGF